MNDVALHNFYTLLDDIARRQDAERDARCARAHKNGGRRAHNDDDRHGGGIVSTIDSARLKAPARPFAHEALATLHAQIMDRFDAEPPSNLGARRGILVAAAIVREMFVAL